LWTVTVIELLRIHFSNFLHHPAHNQVEFSDLISEHALIQVSHQYNTLKHSHL